MTLDSDAIAALDRESYINLATFKRNGDAVNTPVWFAARSGKLYVFTEADSWKVKRLRNDAHIRIAPCNVRGKLKDDWLEGQGRRIDDPQIEQRAYAALLDKYGWQMHLTTSSPA